MTFDDLEMTPLACNTSLLDRLMRDWLDFGVFRAELPLQRLGWDDMTNIALRCALVEIDRRPLPEADFFNGLITNGHPFDCRDIQGLFSKFQMAEETNVLGDFEMLFRCDFEVAGFTRQPFLSFKGLVAKVSLVLETNLFGELDFRVLELFLGVTT